MPKFEGINRNYNTDKEQKKSTQEERDRLMKEFLAKGGKIEKIPSKVTKQMIEGMAITAEVNCFDMCDILRLKLTGYVDTLNLHIMNDGSGDFYGCICK